MGLLACLRHDGTEHTTQDRRRASGAQDSNRNVIAEADGATGVVAKEYIWLPGAGYAGTDLPVGVVDVAGTATPELLYVHADHLGRPIRLTDPAKVTAWAVEWLPRMRSMPSAVRLSCQLELAKPWYC